MENDMKKFLDEFVDSYMERDQDEDFSGWLSKRIQEKCPGMEYSESERVSQEIIEGVAQYKQTLSKIEEAVQSGQSKEEWLAENVAEAYAGIPVSEAGDKLQLVYNEMVSANAELMGEAPEEVTAAPAGTVEWNEYSVKEKVLQIGKQAVVTGFGIAADAIKLNSETVDGQAITVDFQKAASPEEVKAVVAGAIKVAAENKLTNALPSSTSTGTICDIAGVVVEGAEAMYDLSIGESTVTEALDKVGRASVAVASHLCVNCLQKAVFTIPVIGPFAALLTRGLFQRMRAPQFTEKVYTTVRSVAVSAWEGVKQTAGRIKSFVTNTVSNWVFNH